MNSNTKENSQKRKAYLLIIIAIILFLGWTAIPGISSDKKDMGGWELGSKYNKLYDPSELESFKGIVKKIFEITPMKGMSPGIAMVVDDSDEDVLVHVGPAFYVKPGKMGIRKGDKVKVRGVWAEIEGKEVFMLSKVKIGDTVSYKIRRTSDGKPWWTMTAAEVQKEKSGD